VVLTQGGAAARNNGSAGGTGPGTAAWRLATGLHKPPANPTASGKAVYFGTGGGNRIFAVAAQTGRKIWSRPARAVSAAPTVAAGMVCATGEQAYFYAFHAATGALAWTGSSPGNTVLPGHRDWAVAGDRLVIAPDDYNAFLVDTATGKQIWESSPPMDTPYGQSVVVADGIIYALGFYGTLSAIDTATGRRLWNVGLLDQDQQAPQTPALAVSGGNAYINSSYGPLYSVSLTTRKVNWTYQAEAWPTAAPVIAGGLVYFVDHNGTVHAVTMATGKRAWTFPAGITVSISGPAVAGGYVYVATQGGLQQLHATTGAPGWTYTPPGGTKFVSTPAVGNGLVFAGCDDNNLYAIRI
jgi:outer membrane protein assembly factor BamB